MKIPRIKLPDKNLISLREFISGWRVNYHSAGLGRFKLNLGKTTTFPRSTLRHICQQIHSLTHVKIKYSIQERFARLTKLCVSQAAAVEVMFTGGDTEIWLLFSLATLDSGNWWQTSSQQTAQPSLDPDTFQAWCCQLAVSPAPRLALHQNCPRVRQESGPGDKQGDGS